MKEGKEKRGKEKWQKIRRRDKRRKINEEKRNQRPKIFYHHKRTKWVTTHEKFKN